MAFGDGAISSINRGINSLPEKRLWTEIRRSCNCLKCALKCFLEQHKVLLIKYNLFLLKLQPNFNKARHTIRYKQKVTWKLMFNLCDYTYCKSEKEKSVIELNWKCEILFGTTALIVAKGCVKMERTMERANICAVSRHFSDRRSGQNLVCNFADFFFFFLTTTSQTKQLVPSIVAPKMSQRIAAHEWTSKADVKYPGRTRFSRSSQSEKRKVWRVESM